MMPSPLPVLLMLLNFQGRLQRPQIPGAFKPLWMPSFVPSAAPMWLPSAAGAPCPFPQA